MSTTPVLTGLRIAPDGTLETVRVDTTGCGPRTAVRRALDADMFDTLHLAEGVNLYVDDTALFSHPINPELSRIARHRPDGHLFPLFGPGLFLGGTATSPAPLTPEQTAHVVRWWREATTVTIAAR